MSIVRNERTKLLATALNNVAVAIVVTALIATAVGFLYGTTNPAGGSWYTHAAQRVLGKLTP